MGAKWLPCGLVVGKLSMHLAIVIENDLRPDNGRLRLYDMRHSAATIALAAGVSPKIVSEQLGQASTAFTLDTYAHVLPHMQDEAAARVEAMLFGATA
jgi:integrase